MAAAVVVAAAAVRASLVEWGLLVLCIAVVLAAEMFNTALEHLGRAITREENADIREALDMAAGAVLVVSIGAAVVGVLVLVVAPLW
jgi:diacylglycerol kinase